MRLQDLNFKLFIVYNIIHFEFRPAKLVKDTHKQEGLKKADDMLQAVTEPNHHNISHGEQRLFHS